MTPQNVTEKLKKGWELRNHGTGWWLCEPMTPYKRTESLPVPEEIVSQLEADDIIQTKLLTTSALGLLKQP